MQQLKRYQKVAYPALAVVEVIGAKSGPLKVEGPTVFECIEY